MSLFFKKLLETPEELQRLLKQYKSPKVFLELYNKSLKEDIWEERDAYNKEMEEKVADLINLGLSREEVGWVLGRSERQVYRIIKSIRFRTQ